MRLKRAESALRSSTAPNESRPACTACTVMLMCSRLDQQLPWQGLGYQRGRGSAACGVHSTGASVNRPAHQDSMHLWV